MQKSIEESMIVKWDGFTQDVVTLYKAQFPRLVPASERRLAHTNEVISLVTTLRYRSQNDELLVDETTEAQGVIGRISSSVKRCFSK